MFHISICLLTTLCAAMPCGESGRFEFRDAENCQGRSIMRFRSVVLRPTPVSPIESTTAFDAEALYGLVLVGRAPNDALNVVMSRAADGETRLWLDADGDGRIVPEEALVLRDDARLETRALIAVGRSSDSNGSPARQRRTLVFRRGADGEGLQYAVRGYRTGTISIAGANHDGMLTDADADGLFDGPGVDRVWIDLNDDGVFDGLSEQYLLGRPVAVADKKYVIAAEAGGATVRVRQRSTKLGNVQLSLLNHAPASVYKFSAGLVSDIGEITYVDALGDAAPIPVGHYRLASASFELKDADGGLWSYSFAGRGPHEINVRAGSDAAADVLGGLALDVTVRKGVASAAEQDLAVTPKLAAKNGLYLTNCSRRGAKDFRSESRVADIEVLSTAGSVLFGANSGFA